MVPAPLTVELEALQELRSVLDKIIGNGGVMDFGLLETSYLRYKPAVPTPLLSLECFQHVRSQKNLWNALSDQMDAFFEHTTLQWNSGGHFGIYILPDEILGEIFKLSLSDCTEFYLLYPSDLQARLKSAIHLSHVSRTFRRAALACPQLWNILSVGFRCSVIPMLLKRGQAIGFDVRLVDFAVPNAPRRWRKPQPSRPLLRQALSKACHWSTLRIYGSYAQDFLDVLRDQFPKFAKLKKLVLSTIDSHFLRDFQALSATAGGGPLHTITHLTYRINHGPRNVQDVTSFLLPLSQFLALSDLTLTWASGASKFDLTQLNDLNIRLPSLLSLRFCVMHDLERGDYHNMLCHLDMPKLESLYLYCGCSLRAFPEGGESLSSQLRRFGRSWPRLTNFTFHSRLGTVKKLKYQRVLRKHLKVDYCYESLVELMPSVRTIKIIDAYRPPYQPHLLCPDSGPENAGSNPIEVPRHLKHVTMERCCYVDAVYLNAFAKLITQYPGHDGLQIVVDMLSKVDFESLEGKVNGRQIVWTRATSNTPWNFVP